ncbi:cyclin-D5-3-like [Triticum urartu]|uniref:Cyclin-like domain-containing protein n=1 Tax=Triticum urartu TaxID=4572 RepID=A0A8R7U8V2_TRIUA|nr:cyclin-D5-3-like [Triticum urartu]
MGDASTSAAAPATPTSTLICLEDGNDLFLDDDDSPAGGLADSRLAAADGLLLLDRDDEYAALMLSKEGAGAGGGGGACGEELDEWTKAARAACVDWIVKTNARFLFSGKTAYVAVTYLDRFLAQRRVDRGKEWALQLLSVACLSLAAKVEEHRVPRLPEFRPDEYDFDSASILRMELLVLGTLNWRMIAATPFPYLSCFAARFRHDERSAIVLRAVKCIFASIKAMSSVEYQPSTMALASILAARGGSEGTGTGTGPSLEEELKAILGSSWQQLHTGHVYSCYSLMIQEEDRSTQSGREVAASSGVSAAAPTGSPGTSVAMADDNNAIATASADNNKRRRVHSPQPQRQ